VEVGFKSTNQQYRLAFNAIKVDFVMTLDREALKGSVRRLFTG
jgi:hypothetical protein